MPSEKKKRVLLPPAGLDFATSPKDSLVDDLRYALEHAKELYSDIAWDFTLAPSPTIIYAHKAILYARSSRSFQERFLKNKDANGMSIRSVRLSNPEPTIAKTDEDPFLIRQELKFFYTGEEGSEEFLSAVDTTDELEQDKLKEDLIYMFKSKLYTDVELVLDYSEDSPEIVDEEDFKPIKIKAHRFILYTRSEYFKKMLSSDFIEARSSSIHLDASIFNQTSLNIILTFIYTGNIPPSKPLTLDDYEWVWIGADFLGIKFLCDECICRIATKVHHFTCTCAECQSVIPRVAIFAKEHDVDMLWQGCLHVLSHGFDSMWPQKAFADLDEDTREEVLFTVLANIQQNNSVMAAFKGCRKILSNIDIKGIGLPWIETIRGMTHRVQSFTVKNILVDNFEQICSEDQEFLDCVDGVGFSSDLLEDIMNVVVEEGLTEKNAARVLNCITGKLLTRQAVVDSESFETKRVLNQAKQNVFDYMKKRWMSVKGNGGFRLLTPWQLDEFSKELGVTNQELQESTDHKENKPKVRTPSVTNGLSKKGRESSPAPKVTKSITTVTTTTPALIVTTPPQLNPSPSTGGTDSNSGSNTSESGSTSNSSAESSSMGSADTTAKTNAKKGKSVRIGETTTAPVWARPTRASVLRQKALAESSAKNPVKPRIKTNTTTKSASNSSSNSTQSKPTTSVSKTVKTTTTRTPRQSTSASSLRVPNGSPTSQRGRSSNKQNSSKKNTSATSSRASSISSVTSLNSPSVSPSRFGGVRQTRSSMLRQLKYDDAEQRRGRDRERDTSPTSSRASSIASTSSVASTTTSSSHHRRKRSPSQNSSNTSITTNSNGAITCLQPKPHQIKLATIANPDISVGRRVILPTKNNAPGVIQFLGETEFAKGIWVGIELDNPVGKNNGKVASTKYFTAGPNHGIFVRPDSLLLI
ncbi:unnamed protein product [Rhizophagus irregularis]|nr:unnamed protein product [Rhizophagus irregularis]